jgi:hypothetical protein
MRHSQTARYFGPVQSIISVTFHVSWMFAPTRTRTIDALSRHKAIFITARKFPDDAERHLDCLNA